MCWGQGYVRYVLTIVQKEYKIRCLPYTLYVAMIDNLYITLNHNSSIPIKGSSAESMLQVGAPTSSFVRAMG